MKIPIEYCELIDWLVDEKEWEEELECILNFFKNYLEEKRELMKYRKEMGEQAIHAERGKISFVIDILYPVFEE